MRPRTYLVAVGIAFGLFLLIAPPVIMTQRIDDLQTRLWEFEHDVRRTNIASVNHDILVIGPLEERIALLEARVDILTEKASADETLVDRDEELFVLAAKTLSYRCQDFRGDHPEQCPTGFWVYVPSLNDYCFVPDDLYLQHRYNKEGAISDLCGS